MKYLLLIFLYYAEECGVLSFLGLSVLGVNPTKKQILAIAFIQGSIVALVRGFFDRYHVPFGSHIFVLLVCFMLTMKLICHVKWEIASAATILGFVMIGTCETIVYAFVSPLFNINMQQTLEFPLPFLAFAYSSLSPLILLSILVYRTKFSFTQFIGNKF